MCRCWTPLLLISFIGFSCVSSFAIVGGKSYLHWKRPRFLSRTVLCISNAPEAQNVGGLFVAEEKHNEVKIASGFEKIRSYFDAKFDKIDAQVASVKNDVKWFPLTKTVVLFIIGALIARFVGTNKGQRKFFD